MSYIPNFIHYSSKIIIDYPIGTNWNHNYISENADIIFNTYKEDIENGTTIAFVVRGTSGAMIAGAILNELHNINPSINSCILVIRKKNENSHDFTLSGITTLTDARLIVVDDFIQTGETIKEVLKNLDKYFEIPLPSPKEKYDMLCICNPLSKIALKKNGCADWKTWKEILSRFEFVVCSPREEKST